MPVLRNEIYITQVASRMRVPPARPPPQGPGFELGAGRFAAVDEMIARGHHIKIQLFDPFVLPQNIPPFTAVQCNQLERKIFGHRGSLPNTEYSEK